MHSQMEYCLAICCKQSFVYSDKKAPLPPPWGFTLRYIIDNWQLHNKYDPPAHLERILLNTERVGKQCNNSSHSSSIIPSTVADPDPHHFGKPDPDPHLRVKPDPHQVNMQELRPKMEPLRPKNAHSRGVGT
jgi:hypothetical protein